MDKVKKLLEKHNFEIHSSLPTHIWSRRKQDNISLICTFFGELILVSISHGGVRNSRKAKQVVKSIFGDLYIYEQAKVPSVSAVYFNLTTRSNHGLK